MKRYKIIHFEALDNAETWLLKAVMPKELIDYKHKRQTHKRPTKRLSEKELEYKSKSESRLLDSTPIDLGILRKYM